MPQFDDVTTTKSEVKHLIDEVLATLNREGATKAASVASLLSIVFLILDPHVTPETLNAGITEASQQITLMLAGYNTGRGKRLVH